ncbi:MAG: 2-C-methyl-D-erythritol 2,4-cyclodiphosphate synthase [Alphaproteobacteria bacterium]|nr:2-C-methyl-D-erythritol 2,4-cyclodiphosphate synthase [Alphaproteobacteria bacterium]
MDKPLDKLQNKQKVQNKQAVALIVAAGRGVRAGTRTKGTRTKGTRANKADNASTRASGCAVPKQYRKIATQNGMEMVLRQTLRQFAMHPQIMAVQTVIHPDDTHLYEQAADNIPHCLPPVYGGASRQESVQRGLAALATLDLEPAYVLIHDAVRPYVQESTISAVIAALDKAEAVVPGVAVIDTVKQFADGKITATLPRQQLIQAQTPQGFHYDKIRQAYKKAYEKAHEKAYEKAYEKGHKQADMTNSNLTDDAAIAEAAGLSVVLTEGDSQNIKLTTEQDFIHAQQTAYQAQQTQSHPPLAFETRIGFGFDVHGFEPTHTTKQHVMLAGVKIPHTQGLQGHSDADVGLHALTDALLGALAEGDIGQHFPPSDMAHKDRNSADFLSFAAAQMAIKKARITHIDLTFICETPKLSPHRTAMRARIADILGIDLNRVSVKATTTEGLGFIGRKEGIAAQAVVTIELLRTDASQKV